MLYKRLSPCQMLPLCAYPRTSIIETNSSPTGEILIFLRTRISSLIALRPFTSECTAPMMVENDAVSCQLNARPRGDVLLEAAATCDASSRKLSRAGSERRITRTR